MNIGATIPSSKKTISIQVLIVLLLLFSRALCFSQTHDGVVVPEAQASYTVRAEVLNGDTVPVVDLGTIYVITDYVWKTDKEREKWMRMKSDIRVVYPYAILAAAKLKEYDLILNKMPNEQMKKAYLRVCEKDLKNEFEDELKDLSIHQGRLLMKLIDRESGKTTYEIVKQLRGGFQAVMWQAVARLFGNNMKEGYDPVEDIMIERSIKQVEAGNLKF
jgi:hypothetical protein